MDIQLIIWREDSGNRVRRGPDLNTQLNAMRVKGLDGFSQSWQLVELGFTSYSKAIISLTSLLLGFYFHQVTTHTHTHTDTLSHTLTHKDKYNIPPPFHFKR